MTRNATQMPNAVIWDVDGTLVDTAELHFQAWLALAQSRGWPFSRADFAATFGRRNPEIIHQLFGKEFTPDDIASIGEEKEELYRNEAIRGVELLPGVENLLNIFRHSKIPQGVGSSAPRKNIEMILQSTQTSDYFAAMIGMEDTSHGKPHPEVFLNAAAKLNVAPEQCVVFEDAVAGVEAAKNGGMKCVAVTFVGHHPEEKLRAAGADLVVSSLEQVTLEQISQLYQ